MPDKSPPLNAWSAMDRAGQQEIPNGDASRAELWAYLDRYRFAPRESVGVKVHTTASTFDLEVLRDGVRPAVAHRAHGLPGRTQPTPGNAYEIGCDWEDVHTFTIDHWVFEDTDLIENDFFVSQITRNVLNRLGAS